MLFVSLIALEYGMPSTEPEPVCEFLLIPNTHFLDEIRVECVQTHALQTIH